MGKNKRLSHDQKRKAKLKKRAARSQGKESLAYSGSKYRTNELAPVFYRTEVGIYESYVMCDGELVDDEVEAAIERLVRLLREGPLPPTDDATVVTISEGDKEHVVIANIRRNWLIMEAQGRFPTRDDLIGVLRTILNSISVWSSQSLNSQGYLHYIEGFLKKLGVSVRPATLDREPLPEPEEDPVLLIGRAWVTEGDEAAATEFAEQIETMLAGGESERVIHVCQELLGENKDMTLVPRLSELAIRGHRAVRSEMG